MSRINRTQLDTVISISNRFLYQSIKLGGAIPSGVDPSIDAIILLVEKLKDYAIEREYWLNRLSRIIEENSATINDYYLYSYLSENGFIGLNEILIREALIGLRQTDDLNNPYFEQQLRRVLSNPNIIKISITSINPLNVDVNLAMEQYAGTLDDYADAVIAARRALGYGGVSNHPAYVFHNRMYLPAKGFNYTEPYTLKQKFEVSERHRKSVENKAALYWQTMYERVQGMNDLAPFWYLLDHGNLGIHLHSDVSRSGKTYNRFRGTHFVDRAKRRIKEYLERTIPQQRLPTTGEQRELLNRLISNYHDLISAVHELEDIIRQVKEIEAQPATLRERFLDISDKLVRSKIQKLTRYLNISADDFNKLSNTLRIELMSESIGETSEKERISMGSISGRRLRPRMKRMRTSLANQLKSEGFTEEELSNEREALIRIINNLRNIL